MTGFMVPPWPKPPAWAERQAIDSASWWKWHQVGQRIELARQHQTLLDQGLHLGPALGQEVGLAAGIKLLERAPRIARCQPLGARLRERDEAGVAGAHLVLGMRRLAEVPAHVGAE